MSGTLKSLLVKLGVDSKDFDKGMDAADNRTKKTQGLFDGLANVGSTILIGTGAAAIAGGLAIGTLGKAAVMAAGRVEQLIGVNRVLGDNLGISQTLIREQSAGLREQGIEAAVAEESLSKMMQANLDLAGATDIAKVAQNAAVISGSNSSETMSAIIHGITTLNPLVLRSRGLIIDQAKAYEDAAEAAGVKVDALTAAQKQQAIYNAVLTAGEKIEGAYDESMKNPIKQLGSMKRLINDVAVAAGGPLLEGFSSIIASLSEVVKWFGAAVDEGGELRPFLDQAGVWFKQVGKDVGKFLETAIKNIPTFIANLKKAFAWLQANEGVVVGVLTAMGVAVLAFGISVAQAAIAAMIPMLPVIALMLAIAAVAYLVYEAWTNNWGGIQEKLAATISWIVNAFNTLKEGVIAIWNTLWTVIGPIFDAFKAAFQGDWTAFGEYLRIAWDNAWELIKTAFTNFSVWMWDKIIEIIGNIKTWFEDTDWAQVGINIVMGIANGIHGASSFLQKAAIKVVKAAWNAMKGFLGIKSPSKLFAGIGQNMMLGMAGGISDYSKVPVGVTVAATQSVAGTTAASAPAQSGSGIDLPALATMLRDSILQVMD